jgi:hypothetical protein
MGPLNEKVNIKLMFHVVTMLLLYRLREGDVNKIQTF